MNLVGVNSMSYTADDFFNDYIKDSKSLGKLIIKLKNDDDWYGLKKFIHELLEVKVGKDIPELVSAAIETALVWTGYNSGVTIIKDDEGEFHIFGKIPEGVEIQLKGGLI